MPEAVVLGGYDEDRSLVVLLRFGVVALVGECERGRYRIVGKVILQI